MSGYIEYIYGRVCDKGCTTELMGKQVAAKRHILHVSCSFGGSPIVAKGVPVNLLTNHVSWWHCGQRLDVTLILY